MCLKNEVRRNYDRLEPKKMTNNKSSALDVEDVDVISMDLICLF